MEQLIVHAYQHCIISSYIALGQPGGGGSLYPVAIFSTYYTEQNSMFSSSTNV